jgi:predicted RNA binding protein YcfA (HicA-like mRNA interferase family)
VGKRKYPPLTPGEVIAIVQALGFVFDRKCGSHAQYELSGTTERQRRVVTVDTKVHNFDEYLIKSMIRQSGRTREEFYGATKATGKKI